MKITAILCTYNRCESLALALASIAESIVPEHLDWEILVVDNNSNDRSREVVDNFCRRYPGRFRYLFETRQGKSYALNAGIRDARGEILAFVDDDVTVEPTWLHNLISGVVDGNWAGAGGRILPPPGFSPPRWLAMSGPNGMGGIVCAHFDLGDEAMQLDRPPYGTNMAFRKEIFEKYGAFREDMGPCPGSEIRNEDTEFGRRLMAGGERLSYVPSAVVYHEVHESRVQKRFFLAWWFDFGRSAIREAGRRPDIWRIPRHYFTMLKTVTVLVPLRTLRWITTFDLQRRFYRKCWVWCTLGEISEIHRQWYFKKETVSKLPESGKAHSAFKPGRDS